jgi:hypothetical protein
MFLVWLAPLTKLPSDRVYHLITLVAITLGVSQQPTPTVSNMCVSQRTWGGSAHLLRPFDRKKSP